MFFKGNHNKQYFREESMKKLWILLLILGSVIQADAKEDKVCQEARDKFEQIGYLVNKFDDSRGAFAILNRSQVGYHFKNTKSKYKCLDEYKNKYLYLLYKNNKRYLLEGLYRTDKTNYLIPLYLGDLARDNNHVEKALEYYEKYITLKKEHLDKNVLKYMKSGGLEQYKSKWGKQLNPSRDTPHEKFKNIFFGLKDKKIFKTTYSQKIDLQGVATIFGHQTSDIGSYHVGSFNFDKEERYNISLDTGNARACRVIIDDMLFSEKTSFQQKYTFSKGLHKIEIELLSRHSSYRLNFDMTMYQKRYSDRELTKLFDGQEFEVRLVNYQPRYTSSSNAGGLQIKRGIKSVEIIIEESQKPVVLILQSTAKVNWKLKNTKNLKAVIIGKHSNLTDRLTMDSKNKSIYHSETSFKAKKMMPENCRCIGAGAIYLCDTSFVNTYKKIEKILNKPLGGYTYTSEEQFSVPQERVESDTIERLIEKISYDQKACKETQIDKVFHYQGGREDA